MQNEMTESSRVYANRWLLFSCWVVVATLFFIKPVFALVRLSLAQDDASHLILIPFISAVLLFLEHRTIVRHTTSDKTTGGVLLLLAGCLTLASFYLRNHPALGLQLSLWILALVVLWAAGFALLFGKGGVGATSFPLLFLLLMIPIPSFLLDRIILALQEGSAWITGALFDLVGVPVLREGLVFHLTKVSIEVAKECSGIRSSMALLILALLVAHFRLRSFWNQLIFVAFGLFLMILKNGVRIATLTLLAVYVDPDFLFGRLHRQGGVVFFVLALLLLLPLLYFLQRRESLRESKKALAAESA